MNAGALVVDNVKDLDGLSPADIAAAAEAAKARKLDGKWVLPLINTTGQPSLSSLTNRALREKIYRASIARGHQGNDNDVTKVISRLAQLRAQRAKLLGFSSYAAFTLDDQMAKTPEAAIKLTAQVAAAAVKRAKAEAADMQKLIDAQGGGFKLAAVGLAVLLGAGAHREVRARRQADPPVLRARPRPQGRRVLRRAPSSTASRSSSAPTCPSITRTSGSGRCSTPTARRSASSTPTTTRARASTAARGWTASSTRATCAAASRSSSTSSTSRSRRRPAGAAHVRRRDDDVPRVRARAARHVLEGEVPVHVRHEHAARLRRVPVAVQRALGARADRLRELREALPDRRADAGGARREDQEGEDVQSGLRHARGARASCSISSGTRCRRRRRSRIPRRSRPRR